MPLFGKKKEKVVDWRYKRPPTRQPMTQSSSDDGENNLGYLGEMMGAAQPSGSNSDFEDSGDSEKKRKLAKRIYEMTERIEDLSNQIYHLQQRIELLEKKTGRN